ncbi:DUF2269 domain-containing protein [Bacillus sp. ISL-40]|uniref:DUF2269 family protein n=1 Tax=unclassified Bacillus (in: firmicutes) TaxID=185979 RepID=UPI001BE68E6F|nr:MULTISPECIES: DUF2269 domain-containing protein [unclassified Bacillus (in: firmicutes)]MBT2701048.1 DUF2269 domain-containing protein [Bacillus sp. ISL-40]MBT2739296.1 DUF2269 domain-containing protein [Bacillus sp. ISL-77]
MEFLLFLHVLGAVIFLGNIITAAFWKIRADIKGDPELIHNTVKNVMLADFIFTLPGLILIIVSGILMAVQAGYSMSGLNWLTLSLILFVFTGVLWFLLLLPIQRSMIRHSAQSIEEGDISKSYRKASRYWAIFGITATLLPVIILYFMIIKGF